MKKLLIAVMMLFGLGSASGCGAEKGFNDMNVEEFRNYLELPEVQLLDVRTPGEYADGHIPNALNIDIYDKNFDKEVEKELSKDRPVAVYCRSGKRSAEAADRLAKAGYEVTNLLGGILAWQASRQHIVK